MCSPFESLVILTLVAFAKAQQQSQSWKCEYPSVRTCVGSDGYYCDVTCFGNCYGVSICDFDESAQCFVCHVHVWFILLMVLLILVIIASTVVVCFCLPECPLYLKYNNTTPRYERGRKSKPPPGYVTEFGSPPIKIATPESEKLPTSALNGDDLPPPPPPTNVEIVTITNSRNRPPGVISETRTSQLPVVSILRKNPPGDYAYSKVSKYEEQHERTVTEY